MLILSVGSVTAKKWAQYAGLLASIISMIDDLVALFFVPLPVAGSIGTTVVLFAAAVVIILLLKAGLGAYLRGNT